MPKKRITKGLGSLTASIDHDAFGKVLAEAGVPPDKMKMAHQRVEELLTVVRTMEADIGLNSERSLLIKRPQTQARNFDKAAEALRVAAEQLKTLDQPRQRLERHPETGFYVPEIGTHELKDSIGQTILSLLNSEFLRQYDIHIEDFALRPDDRLRHSRSQAPVGGIGQTNGLDLGKLVFALTDYAIPITAEALSRLADAVSSTAVELARRRKLGGPTANPIREIVIKNLTLLWNQIFDSKKPTYVDESYRDFFDFVQKTCTILGNRNYCSEHFIRMYNKQLP